MVVVWGAKIHALWGNVGKTERFPFIVFVLSSQCIPDIFYNTVLVDRVCRHVAVKVQTVGPFDLHHSVLKKKFEEIEEIGNWFLTSFKWLGFAIGGFYLTLDSTCSLWLRPLLRTADKPVVDRQAGRNSV